MNRLVARLLVGAIVATYASSGPPGGPCLAGEGTSDLSALVKRVRPSVLFLLTRDKSGRPVANATGFLVSEDGFVLTNHHVLDGAWSVVARTAAGVDLAVEGYMSEDKASDLVVLKVPGTKHPALRLSSGDAPEPGVRVLVVGNPHGLEGTVTDGIVSAVRPAEGLLQISAAISPGSSGSPVLNMAGEVIGVAVSSERDGQSLNFAVPAAAASRLIEKARLVPKAQPIERAPRSPFASAAELIAAGKYPAVLRIVQAYSNSHPDAEEWLPADLVEARRLEDLVKKKYLERDAANRKLWAAGEVAAAIDAARELAKEYLGTSLERSAKTLLEWFEGNQPAPERPR